MSKIKIQAKIKIRAKVGVKIDKILKKIKVS